VISHQYDLLVAKMSLKYGGKSLAQLIDSCRLKNNGITQDKLLQTVVKYINTYYSDDIIGMMGTQSKGIQTVKTEAKKKSEKKKKKKKQHQEQPKEPVPTDIFT
jgi:hypothetical protein